jgi:hypothetical protein
VSADSEAILLRLTTPCAASQFRCDARNNHAAKPCGWRIPVGVFGPGPSLLSSENANWSKGSSRLCSADTSILTARAFESLDQHSGDFVLMCLSRLMITTRKLEAAEMVCRATTETKQVAVQATPKPDATPGRDCPCAISSASGLCPARITFSRRCSLSGVKM